MITADRQTKQSRSPFEFIANSPVPLEIKSIEVLPDGSLRCHAPDNVAFSFEYFGIQFHGAIDRGDAPARLALSADLGPLPFSFDRPERRHNIRRVVATANRLGGALFSISESQHILLAGEIDVTRPVTASALLVSATRFIMAEKPVLDLLALVLADGERDREVLADGEQDREVLADGERDRGPRFAASPPPGDAAVDFAAD